MGSQTRVLILGDEYPIKGDVDGDTTRKVVDYMNQKVTEVRGMSSSFDKLKIAILSALNITGELFEYRTRAEHAERELTELEQRAVELTDRINGAL